MVVAVDCGLNSREGTTNWLTGDGWLWVVILVGSVIGITSCELSETDSIMSSILEICELLTTSSLPPVYICSGTSLVNDTTISWFLQPSGCVLDSWLQPMMMLSVSVHSKDELIFSTHWCPLFP